MTAHEQVKSHEANGGTSSGKGVGGTGVSPVRTPVTQELLKQRRDLPHWQLGGSTYFITFRLKSGTLNQDERRIVLDACRHWDGKRLMLHIATVMPDHVHLIFTPHRSDANHWYSTSALLHSIKSFTSHEIQKCRKSTGALWQEESFDRIIRDEDEYLEKWNYVWTNPVRIDLTTSPEDYPFTYRRAEDARTGETPVPPNVDY